MTDTDRHVQTTAIREAVKGHVPAVLAAVHIDLDPVAGISTAPMRTMEADRTGTGMSASVAPL
jgi:hypothetical protein